MLLLSGVDMVVMAVLEAPPLPLLALSLALLKFSGWLCCCWGWEEAGGVVVAVVLRDLVDVDIVGDPNSPEEFRLLLLLKFLELLALSSLWGDFIMERLLVFGVVGREEESWELRERVEEARESRSLNVLTLELLGVATTIPCGCGRSFFFFEDGMRARGGTGEGGRGRGDSRQYL